MNGLLIKPKIIHKLVLINYKDPNKPGERGAGLPVAVCFLTKQRKDFIYWMSHRNVC